jgi:hypothetical protein
LARACSSSPAAVKPCAEAGKAFANSAMLKIVKMIARIVKLRE